MKKYFLASLILLLSLAQTKASINDSTKFRKLNIKKHCISYKKGDTLPFTGIAYKNYIGGRRQRSIKLEYGLPEGKTINYYRNGKIESIEIWKNGSIQSRIGYYKSGAKKHTTEYENGSYSYYKIIAYAENGAKEIEYRMSNGNLNGVYKTYHSNGRLYALKFYDNGKKAGTWVYYDETGKEESKEHYKDGEMVSSEYIE